MIYRQEFTYEAEKPINIGDVFYMVEPVNTQYYREPCVVCGDTRKVTVNGVTFTCPVCNDGHTGCRVVEYAVRRYRVYGFSSIAQNDDWKASKHRTEFIHLYHKRGRGYSQFSGTHKEKKTSLKHFIGMLNNDGVSINNLDSVFFDDYKKAVAFAKRLTEEEVKKLTEFNELHGCCNQFVPRAENDNPSK